jgi:hypothetical protein
MQEYVHALVNLSRSSAMRCLSLSRDASASVASVAEALCKKWAEEQGMVQVRHHVHH